MKTIQEITAIKTVKMNSKNFWLLELIYGDAAYDKTAKFQIPKNVYFK
jgi:hypothetical protein